MVPRRDVERSLIVSTAGGVMTEEAGTVTGDLELFTRLEDSTLRVSVRYAGAQESYTVAGSPASISGGPPLGPAALHARVAEHLSTPGPVVEGNEKPRSLEDFSPT